MNRPTKHKYYLNIASEVAKRSTCNRRQYGAVLVKDDRIIATGYNGAARGEPNCCDIGFCARQGKPHNTNYTSDCPAIHAECNAIMSAGRESIGAILYVAGWENGARLTECAPCIMCQRLIKNAGIQTVITEA